MKKLFLAIALIIATASVSANAIEIICINPNSVATTDWGRNIEKKANEALKKHREEKANKEREKYKEKKEKKESNNGDGRLKNKVSNWFNSWFGVVDDDDESFN